MWRQNKKKRCAFYTKTTFLFILNLELSNIKNKVKFLKKNNNMKIGTNIYYHKKVLNFSFFYFATSPTQEKTWTPPHSPWSSCHLNRRPWSHLISSSTLQIDPICGPMFNLAIFSSIYIRKPLMGFGAKHQIMSGSRQADKQINYLFISGYQM